jgi:acyl-CoA reductase-like NAD-dependent aldehyde dehydrogenase
MIVQGENTIAVRNPVTGAVLERYPVYDTARVAALAERAQAAQGSWAATPVRQRARIIGRWADQVWREQARIVATIRAETGKSTASALQEIAIIDNTAAYYTRRGPGLLRPQTRRSLIPLLQRVRIYQQPHGVVGLITPWNYPFMLPFIDLIPALIAGNTVILKPSECTPLSVRLGVELLREAGLPPDVVQIAYGDGATGIALVDAVDYINFTGSTPVGRAVAQQAAARLIPCSLELGGKDPLIVLRDADMRAAARGLLLGAFESTGQACASIERVYVEAPVYAAFLAEVEHALASLTLGADANAHVGSMTREAELHRVEAHIADALDRGARLLCGGRRRPDLGPLFFEPTLLADCDHSMAVMREESFGPVAAIMPVADAAEAVDRANDSVYGLSGCIYTRDMGRGIGLARRIRAGDISINRPLWGWSTPAAPMGGTGASGLGRRKGIEGLLRFVTPRAIICDSSVWLIPQDLIYTTPLLQGLYRLRRRLLPFLPFLRP